MLLIKNADVYAPEHIGKKDILICGEHIEVMADRIENLPGPCKTLEADGMCLIPGLMDQHVHVTGGGGEGSFHTRTPEVELSELIRGGVTTVLGLLGTDGMTRSVENLYAKTAALLEEGVTAYMLTGAYGNPGPTITGEPDRDMVFIREVLGLKLAISDHRAPHVTTRELIRLASKVRVAGMLSGKPGMLVLHMGDDPACLDPVFAALRESQVPVSIFRPTHVNRNPALLEAGWKFLEMGGYVDLTCGMKGQPSPGECIRKALERGLCTERLTVSSDGHGSWSTYAEDGTLLEMGVSGMDSLLKELTAMVNELGFGLAEALPYVTSHVAEALGLGSVKGYIREGYDADLLLLTPRMELKGVITRGTVMMEEGELKHWGTYEKLGGRKNVSE